MGVPSANRDDLAINELQLRQAVALPPGSSVNALLPRFHCGFSFSF